MPKFDTAKFKVQRKTTREVLPLPAGDRWIFASHPEMWEVEEVDGVDRWVPVLRRFFATPGVNAVPESGDTSKMEYIFTQRGWTFIHNSGVAGEYVIECACRGGTVWLDKWTSPNEFVPGKVKLVMDAAATAAFSKWRAGLIGTVIQEPNQFLLDHVMEQFEDNHITRHAARMGDVAVAAKVARAQKRLDRMKAAKVHAPKPATKPRRPRG